MSDFGKRLRAIREAKGITLYRLAHLTGLSKQGVINLEDEDADPKLSTLIKLAEALAVESCELLPGSSGADGAQQSTVVDPRLVELIEELEEWGAKSEWHQSPVALRVIAFKLRKLFGLPQKGRPRRRGRE